MSNWSSFILDVKEFSDLKVSLSLNLYDKYFTIQNLNAIYNYDNSTKKLFDYIDKQILPNDLCDILELTHSAYYYDGCLIVELRDFRGINKEIKNQDECFSVKRVLLKPWYGSIINDIQQHIMQLNMNNDSINKNSEKELNWTQDEIISVEKKILQYITPPICLDPSPKLFHINNILNYNQQKYNYKTPRYIKRKLLMSSSIEQQKTILNNSSLYRFLFSPTMKDNLQKNSVNFSIKAQRELNRIINKLQNLEQPILSREISNPLQEDISTLHALAEISNSYLKFHTNGGKTFCCLYVVKKPINTVIGDSGEGYIATLRVGKAPDNGMNGEILSFSLGNESSAIKFISQLKQLFAKEGIILETRGTQISSSTTEFQEKETNEQITMNKTLNLPTTHDPIIESITKIPSVETNQNLVTS
jgi:hypothetical protein